MKHAVSAVCVLLLLCSCGEGESPSAAPTGRPDTVQALEELVRALYDAATQGRADEAGALSRALLLPDAPQWFERVFGKETGARLAAEYEPSVGRIGTLPELFPSLKAQGQTELRVERHDRGDDDAATGFQAVALQQMKAKVALYSVRFLVPGESSGFSLWSFVHVGGDFRFAGKMKQVDPQARSGELAMLGELRRRDAREFLETGSFPDGD